MSRLVLSHQGPARPKDDPLPWLTETWRRNGCFTTDSVTAMESLRDRMSRGEKITGAAAFSSEVVTLNAILASVRSTVGGLHDDSTPYGVSFQGSMDTAATDLLKKVVIIGTKALTDPDLTEGQKAAILTGIAGHEVGHINESQEFTLAVVEAFKDSPDIHKALALSNIGDDNRVERNTSRRYPGGIATCISAAMWFISRQQVKDLLEKGVEFPIRPKGLTARDRKQCLTLAARYPHLADWSGQSAMDMLVFGHSWAERMAECVSPSDHVALVREAIEWINDVPEPPVQEEQEEQESEDSDDDSDESESGESNDDDTEGEDEEAEADGEGSDGSDSEESDEDGKDGEAEGDADDDAEGDDEDGDGAGDDSDESESDDEGDGDAEGDTDEDESTEGGDTQTGKSKSSQDGEADEDDDAEDGDGESNGNPSDPWSDEDESDDDEDGDTEGDTEGDDEDGDEDSDESESDSESDTKQSDQNWSDEKDEPSDEMPDLGESCATEVARDPKDDALAEAASAAHEHARADVKHMRRYPDAVKGMAEGGVLVFRRELNREQRAARKRGMGVYFASLNTGVTESDTDAQAAANRPLPVAGELIQRKVGGDILMDERAQYSTRRVSIESPTRAAAIAAVLNSARRGPGAPERGVRSGRIDRGRLARVASMDTRVFVNRQAAAPQRLRVHIMLDASASMKGETANRAVQAGRDLIAAMDSIPWIAARVYAQTDDYLGSGLPFVAPLWESGEKRDLIDDYHALINGNTPEGYCLAYVADDLLEDLRPSEKGVVIVISDGEPSYTNGEEHVAEVVGYYRRRGLRVVSVSVAAALREATQRRMYGNDFVAYNANVSLFARGLAKVIGSSL